MSLYKLTEVEAFRAQVLLEESLKKLNFLTSISSSSSVHGDELTQFMGEEISRIIQEQRDLEKQYEDLIAKRSQLKGLSNKGKFLEVQKKIQDVAHRLKESNKSLCRNLKENPNVQGNVLKMQAERSQVQEWLEETKSDLIEFSFANLVSKVDQERRKQEQLSEVRKKEREASQTVQQLEKELAREQSDHQKDTESAGREIKELKEELMKNKTISEIELKFEEKKLRAQEQALLRIHAQAEKELLEELDQLKGAKDMETTVHNNANVFLEEKLSNLQNMKEEWQKTSDTEMAAREADFEKLKEKRLAAFTELTEKQERRRAEALEHEAKEDEMRNAVLIEKQRLQQLQRMSEAVLFLQDEGRRYLERIAARNAAKKGKKGKKGKKK